MNEHKTKRPMLRLTQQSIFIKKNVKKNQKHLFKQS